MYINKKFFDGNKFDFFVVIKVRILFVKNKNALPQTKKSFKLTRLF